MLLTIQLACMLMHHDIVMFALIPYRCEVGQPDALQHNGMPNTETAMCIWNCKEHSEPASLEDGKSTTPRE